MARPVQKRKATTTARAPKAVPMETTGWWERLSNRNQHLISLVLLLLVSISFFAPVHFSGKSLVASDIVQWRAMADDMIEYREKTGQEPLWAPNAFAGIPGYTFNYPNEVPQLDTIANWLRTLIWPTSHFFLLLVGTYLLVVLLTKDKLAGILGAVAYGLTTYIPVILIAGHNTKFIALCYTPWLVLAFVYALRRPGLLSGLLFAAALSINLRAGHIQITYYVTFLLAVWWIVELVTAIRAGRVKPFGMSTAWMAFGAVLGVMMVAQPYLVLAEYKKYTVRGATTGGEVSGGLDWTYAMNWSQGLGELVTLAVADAYGGGGGLYWGPKPFTAGPHYIGGIALLLAILGLWKYRRATKWGLGIAIFFMILFALGENFPLLNRPMYQYFPLFSAFRAPETWLSVVAFALAVLAGVGLYIGTSRQNTPEETRDVTRSVYIACGAAIGFMLLLLVMRSAFFDFAKPDEAQMMAQQYVAQRPEISPNDPGLTAAIQQEIARRKTERAALYNKDAIRTLLFLLVASALLIAYRKGKVPGWIARGAIAVLVVADLWSVGHRYLNEDVLVDADLIEQEITKYDFDDYLLQHGGDKRGIFRVLSFEADPSTNARPSYFYESLGGYSAAKLRLYQDYLDHLMIEQGKGLPDDNALDMLSVRYVIAAGVVPGMKPVYQSRQIPGMLVLENADALPRAWFVGDTEVIQEASATWRRIQDDTFNPRRTAILPAKIDLAPAPIDSARAPVARLEQFSPREIRYSLNTDRPRLLVVSEVYYPAGWKAELDGKEVPILRANYLLRAVQVPAGSHRLTMRFDPASHRIGVTASAIGTVVTYGGIVGLLGLMFFRRRKQVSE